MNSLADVSLKIEKEIEMKVIDKSDLGRNGIVYKILFKRNGRQFTYNFYDVRRRGVTFRSVVIDLFNHTQSVTHYNLDGYMRAFGIVEPKEGIKRYRQSGYITSRALNVFENPKVINYLVEKWQEEAWEDRWERV